MQLEVKEHKENGEEMEEQEAVELEQDMVPDVEEEDGMVVEAVEVEDKIMEHMKELVVLMGVAEVEEDTGEMVSHQMEEEEVLMVEMD